MPKSHLYAIWYACIASGFFLLGLYRVFGFHENGFNVVLRFVIAGAFAVLAVLMFRTRL
jgi:hypothetical protein